MMKKVDQIDLKKGCKTATRCYPHAYHWFVKKIQ
jgi:hypothetical protein